MAEDAEPELPSERLRAYVRERVKPGRRYYKRGTAAALARHLKELGHHEDAAWIAQYADPDAKPKRNADVDTALAICAFFNVNLHDFGNVTTSVTAPIRDRDLTLEVPHDALPAASLERAHLREVAKLKAIIARYEARLRQVRDGARRIANIATGRGEGRASTRRGA